MKESVGTPVIIGIIVVVVIVLGYFAFKMFGPPAMTGAAGGNPYAGRPAMKNGPGGGSVGHMGGSGGPGSGGPTSGGAMSPGAPTEGKK